MNEGGFDFGGTGRREPRSFEVPPWEQDAFDQLKKDQPEQPEDEAQVTTEPVADLASLIPEVVPTISAAPQAKSDSGSQESPDEQPGSELDHQRVSDMLAQLAAEETPARREYWKIALAASALLAAIGMTMVVWGMVATAKTREAGGAGVAGGLLLTAVGAAFAGIAVYVAVKTLRDRGVL